MRQMAPVKARTRNKKGLLAVAAALALTLAGCASGTGGTGETGAAGPGGAEDPGITEGVDGAYPVVAVSSFPLLYIAQQVGGDQVEILDLSTTSGHAHDMELSPSQVNQLGKSDLALYLSEGFQPSVEAAIQQTGVGSLDGFSILEANIPGDPHVWMNPLNIAAIAQELSTALDQANPENGGYYKKNALELTANMDQIDQEYSRVLADCGGATLLTAHEAFGYLAQRYDLDQVGVMGVDPEAEPSPARLRQVMDLIKERDIQFLFAEPVGGGHDHGEDEDEGEDHAHETAETTAPGGTTMAVNASGEKIAATLGISALALDPMEAQTDPNHDVPEVFMLNLASLQAGLACAAK